MRQEAENLVAEKPDCTTYFELHSPVPPLPIKRSYDVFIPSLKNDIEASGGSFAKIIETLNSARDSYSPSDLLFVSDPQNITLKTKPYESLMNKVYRSNCLYNKMWPKQPVHGFINGDNYLENINDIFRTRVICKYMDGPKLICRKFSESFGDDVHFYPQNTRNGYHSWHLYVTVTVPIARTDGEVIDQNVCIEIQIVTQLADALNELTHGVYEEVRQSGASGSGNEWQWEPDNPRFRAAFAGHSIHMLEGVLLEMKQLRYDQAGDTDEEH